MVSTLETSLKRPHQDWGGGQGMGLLSLTHIVFPKSCGQSGLCALLLTAGLTMTLLLMQHDASSRMVFLER